MYEVLIKLYYELDYRSFTIEDLKEIKEVLNQFKEPKQEVKIKKIGTQKGSGKKWAYGENNKINNKTLD